MVDKKTIYKPDIAIHPGETLKDELDFIGLTQVELSQRTGISEKHISQIINGVEPITSETALKLEFAIGTPASFWSNFQNNYELSLARIEEEKRILTEVEKAKKFICYNELADLDCVEKNNDWKIKTENLLKFFGVNSLSMIQQTEDAAFRQAKGNFNKFSLAAWLRCGEIDSRKIETKDFNKTTVKKILSELKKLTCLPNNFGKTLQDICAAHGIAVVYTPYFRNTKINGASRWIGGKAVIQLNVKGAYNDIFWFTFFHEVGHILLHGIKNEFIDYDGKKKDDKEKEADRFASEILMPEKKYKKLLGKEKISISEVSAIAKSNGVSKSIILGRLAHDGRISWRSIARFRERLVIKPI